MTATTTQTEILKVIQTAIPMSMETTKVTQTTKATAITTPKAIQTAIPM